jgi:DNA-binding LacI/PurR family transcriptional regulator
MTQRATLSTVAARAGVSPSTASLAFAGSPRVAPATVERVLRAADELGYAGPDPIAASLRRGRSGVVGAVIGERLLYAFRDPVAVQLLDGLTEVLGELGVGLLLLAGDGGPPPAQLGRVPLDAAVFATCGLEDDPAFRLLQARRVPLVAVEGPVVPGVPLVGIEDREGTAELAAHLRDLGHRRVAMVAMPLRLDGRRGPVDAARLAAGVYRDTRERLLGAREVFPGLPAVECASNSIEEGERAGAALLDGPDRPTAVIAQSDLLAAGVLRAAAARGLDVPRDLSVAGFDGVDLPWLAPTLLTTVVQPTIEKGRLAGRAVADLLAGRTPADVMLPVTLRPGTTTAQPAAEST